MKRFQVEAELVHTPAPGLLLASGEDCSNVNTRQAKQAKQNGSMNPFNLPNLEFLLFYLCFSIVVIIVMVLIRILAESGDPPKMDLSDPYLVAYLRGGENESVQVAVISLMDRRILAPQGQKISRTHRAPNPEDLHPIESEVLKKFSIPRIPADIFRYHDPQLRSLLDPYNEKLQLAGLISNSDIRRARIMRLVITIIILGLVAMIKTVKDPYDIPFRLMFLVAIVAMVIAGYCSFPRLTTRGKRALADIRNLYSGLRTKVNSSIPGKPGASTAELAMSAAVFGSAALAGTSLASATDLLSKGISDSSSDSSSSSSSGSSCSSSDDALTRLNTWYEEKRSLETSTYSCSSSSDEGSSCGSSSDD
jgi:uncharacterized protein (TIGR04222 family)